NYLGRWYEIYRTNNIRFEKGTNIFAEYSKISDLKIKVKNSQYLPKSGKWDSIEGTAKVLDPKKPTDLGVKFFFFQPRALYRILYTDYGNFAVVYNESSIFGFFKTKRAWILSRRKTLSSEEENAAFDILHENGIGTDL